ncbi:MAG: ABC transporter ATP-binding protein [Bacilli bacterium]
MIFGKHINKYYFKYIHFFIFGIAALIAVDFAQLEIPELIGSLIDLLETKTADLQHVEGFIVEMLKIMGIMFVGRFLWRYTIFGNGVRIETDLREKMFKHSEKMSQSYYQLNKVGGLMALYTNDLSAVRQSFGQGIVMLVDALFLGTIALYKMFNLELKLTLLSLFPLIVMAIAAGIIGRYMRKKFEERQKAYADLSDFSQESFSGIAVIKAFVKESKELTAFSKVNQNSMDKNIEFVKAATLLRILIGVLISSVIVIILGYGGYLVYTGNVSGERGFTIGDLTKFIAFFSTLTWPMMAISQLINLRSQAKASLNRINTLLNEKAEVSDKADVNNDVDITGNIEFKNLNFTYPNSENQVLHDISFSIKKGESVGIVGRTGSGKTTIVDLLLRIYNIEPGTLFLDGEDIMNLPIKKVRESIAYVPQDNFLFSDTIENNIGFYSKNTNKSRVVEAAKLADVDENISEFKEKYGTILGERGVTVSGGQKQRISIARALIKDAPILILDDSVSAVDTKTEEQILENLSKIRKGKTTILIAHRVTTIKNMDKVLIIDEGRVNGFGTHDELVKTNELYNNMIRLQKLEDEVRGEDNE